MKATMTNTETAEGMTPRSDSAIIKSYTERSMVPWDFARQLERELASARAEVERLKDIQSVDARRTTEGAAALNAIIERQASELSTANAARRDAEAKVEEMREALEGLAPLASDHINHDPEMGPHCSSCNMELDEDGQGHSSQCCANAILQSLDSLSTTIPGKSRVAELERAARDIDKAIGLLFWTSDDGESIRDGQPEDTDAPEHFQKAWRRLRAALTPPKAASGEVERKERCEYCQQLTSDWLDPDWARGRICRPCYCQRDSDTGEPLPEKAASAAGEAFQARVRPWLLECFGAEIANDIVERNHRFLEEALELVQSKGCTQSESHQLVDYVFNRDVGEPMQEAGGVMVTLAALCLASGLDMHEAGETELRRIWTKVEKIRAKQAAKPKHSPLPMEPTTPATAPEGQAPQ